MRPAAGKPYLPQHLAKFATKLSQGSLQGTPIHAMPLACSAPDIFVSGGILQPCQNDPLHVRRVVGPSGGARRHKLLRRFPKITHPPPHDDGLAGRRRLDGGLTFRVRR